MRSAKRAELLFGVGAGVLGLVMLFTAVHLAARIPASGLLDPFGNHGDLDYAAAGRTAFVPLRDSYVDRVLGGGLPGPSPFDAASVRTGLVHQSRRETALRDANARTVLNHPFTNDRFADAITIPSIPFTARTDTRRASPESGEPATCAPVGGTVWYQYTPARAVHLVADTFGTSYATTLAVFAGRSLGSLRQLGCDKSATGNAQVGFAAEAGTTYWFQIAGPAGGGDLVFNLAAIGATSLVSVSSSGQPGNDNSYDPAHLSADGRYVSFYSRSTNLGGRCQGDLCAGNFLRDRVAGSTAPLAFVERTNESAVSAGGSYVDSPDIYNPAISGDGRFSVFHTDASSLVPNDGNGDYDVFLYDIAARRMERVSVSSEGREAHAPAANSQRSPASVTEANYSGSKFASVSGDGRFVVFTSNAIDLVPGDNAATGSDQVYVRDRALGTTERISYDPSGRPFGRAEVRWGQSISADGRFVAFMGWEQDPVTPGPRVGPERVGQIYLYDRALRTTTLVSHSTAGNRGDADSYFAAVSADGSRVAFVSEADDLVANDTNGTACVRSGADTCGVDFFSYDAATGRVVRVSVNSSGDEQVVVIQEGGLATNSLLQPTLSSSADGRFVAFSSLATNLVPGDSNGKFQIYVHDLVTGATVRASVSSTGAAASEDAIYPAISGDGAVVTFMSASNNLVPGADGLNHVFAHELS
jgi:Tol biopolymer transport system component